MTTQQEFDQAARTFEMSFLSKEEQNIINTAVATIAKQEVEKTRKSLPQTHQQLIDSLFV